MVGRAELLAALFYLLSFQCYVKATHQSKDFPPENFSYGFLGMAVILCGISTLCKETGITVLASCATYDLVYACHLSGRDVLYGVTRLWFVFVFTTSVACLCVFLYVCLVLPCPVVSVHLSVGLNQMND